MNLKNIVVIRFSVHMARVSLPTVYGEGGTRESWFAMRANLFKRTIHKSLLQQTTKPAKVYILMHPKDRALYEKYLNLGNTITPIFCDRMEYREAFEADMAASNLLDSPLTISRIDSDDVLASDYFEQLNRSIEQALGQNKKFKYVVSCRGFRTDYVSIQETFHDRSPFIALFMEKYAWESIYSFEHTRVVEYPHIQNHTAKWMQILHGSNISNCFVESNLSLDEFNNALLTNPKKINTKMLAAANNWPQGFESFAPIAREH